MAAHIIEGIAFSLIALLVMLKTLEGDVGGCQTHPCYWLRNVA